MKELSTEKKAKRYDEAYKVADNIHRFSSDLAEIKRMEEIFPELKESEDERIRKEIISFIQDDINEINLKVSGDYYDRDKEDIAHKNWCKKAIAWLEKQGKQKSLYVRFGDIPDNEQSKIYNGENEIDIENGVSVYSAFIDGDNVILGLTLPITKTTLYTQQHLLEYDARPCYLVTGDYVGKGTDGEPLIKNISIIKEIKNYRIKELEKQSEQKPVIEMKTPEESLGIDSETYNEIVNACIFGENKSKFKIGDWIIYSNEEVHLITGFDDNGYFVDKCYIPFNCEGNMRLWTIQDTRNGDVLAADPWSDYSSSFVAIYKKQNEEDFDTFDSYCFVGFDGKFYEGICGHSTENIHPATKEQCDIIFQKMKETGYEWDAEKKELKKINKQHLISNYFNAEYERGKTDALKSVAWNEEDENRINHLIAYFEDKEGFTAEDDIAYANWLKSIKERCTWKPSDEQMHAFKQVYD